MGVKFRELDVNLPCRTTVQITEDLINEILGIEEEEKVERQSCATRNRRVWFDMDDHDFDWQDMQDYYDGY